MKTKTLLLSLTVALALTAGAAPAAWALETEFVATGTVNNSYDYNGIFGTAGSSLDGDTFTATAYIDTSLGTLQSEPDGSGQYVSGGPVENTTNPVFEMLEINNKAFNFGPSSSSFYGSAVINDDSDDFQGEVSSSYNDPLYFIQITAYGDSLSVPSKFGQSFYVSSDTTPFNSNSGFQIYAADGSTEAVGGLNITTISSPGIVNFTSPAPEPSAWALLITGVGVSGVALRLGRRRGWAMA